jgi:hypothetical protein
MRPSRPARAELPRRTLCGVWRAVVLGGGQQLGNEYQQHRLACRLRVGARSAADAEGEDEQGGEIAPHRP